MWSKGLKMLPFGGNVTNPLGNKFKTLLAISNVNSAMGIGFGKRRTAVGASTEGTG